MASLVESAFHYREQKCDKTVIKRVTCLSDSYSVLMIIYTVSYVMYYKVHVFRNLKTLRQMRTHTYTHLWCDNMIKQLSSEIKTISFADMQVQ